MNMDATLKQILSRENTQQIERKSTGSHNHFQPGEKSEFAHLLEQESGSGDEISFSSHATKRIQERNLVLDGDEFVKLKEAINKLRSKGGKDSLVITNNAAYIVDVNNSKVVTAMDKNSMSENVFTKIDSTLFVN